MSVGQCANTLVCGHVPTPEFVYLTRLGIQNPPVILGVSGSRSDSSVGRGVSSPVSYSALLSG